MKTKKNLIIQIMVFISLFVLAVSITALFYGDFLASRFDVIGIRIATLFVAFVSFCSTSTFSFLVFMHNKTVSKINDDANRRGDLFRELQFTSGNYSIIEFRGTMNVYNRSKHYISKYRGRDNLKYHMFLSDISTEDFFENTSNYIFLTVKIPFVIVEGKMIASLAFTKIRLDRSNASYYFVAPTNKDEVAAFVLFNEDNKKNSAIINLVIDKNSDFFKNDEVNIFSKIKIYVKTRSLLGVEVGGIIELYFTEPEIRETDGTNTYHINSSNFKLLDLPKLVELHSED